MTLANATSEQSAPQTAVMEAARICLEAGATAAQAREAAAGYPVLVPLAEAMEVLEADYRLRRLTLVR